MFSTHLVILAVLHPIQQPGSYRDRSSALSLVGIESFPNSVAKYDCFSQVNWVNQRDMVRSQNRSTINTCLFYMQWMRLNEKQQLTNLNV